MKSKKVLIIDDERDIHALLKKVLEGLGHQVLSALDTTQGLMMARRTTPDLIILDINMPGGGGKMVYDRVRSIGSLATIPILVYSARPKEELEREIPERRDTAILTKPQRIDVLYEEMARLLA